MIRSRYLAGVCAYALAIVLAPMATAQLPAPAPIASSPLNVTLPTPVPTLTPIPAPVFTPQPVSTRTPTPTPTATAPATTSSATPRVSRVRQVPVAPTMPSPAASPTAVPSAETPTPAPTLVAPPTVVDASPTPAATAPVPATPPAEPFPWGYILGAVAVLFVLATLAWLFRRRRAAEVLQEGAAPYDPATDPELAPAVAAASAVASAPEGERAHVTVSATPRRAGVNLLTATVDIDVALENRGTLPASAVAVAVTLTSAGVEQDRTLGELFAGPQPRPAVTPFALQPGERRAVRVLATMPRSAIAELSAAGRPMFVPVVALDVRYDSGAGQGQTAQALAVGVERVGAAKLAPFWLDGPPRMFDTVAMRAHGVAVER